MVDVCSGMRTDQTYTLGQLQELHLISRQFKGLAETKTFREKDLVFAARLEVTRLFSKFQDLESNPVIVALQS